jgi:hypothetical protein
MPAASARINGTVKAPVVAPDASKEIARNSGDVNNASIDIIKYRKVSVLYRGRLKTILTRPNEINSAIPTDTTITILPFEISPDVMESAWPARICRSGSAMEMKKPRNNPDKATTQILLLFAMLAPIKLPIGVIPISTPNKKTVNPIITNTVPMMNLQNNGISSGVSVKFSINTMAAIGITDKSTSLNLVKITSNNCLPLSAKKW